MGRHRLYANATERQRAHRQKHRMRLPAPCVQIGDLVTLYQGDACAIAPMLQDIDAMITDPPYGTNFDFTKPRRSHQPLQYCSVPAARWAANIRGDDVPFDPTPRLGYPQVILWGANHYASRLPDSAAWLIWDKRGGMTSDAFSDVELAWTNLRSPARLFTHLWRGIIRAGEANVSRRGKLHPAEKPVELLQWCVAKTTGTVLDPYMGSGTTGAACVRLGRASVGIELDPDAFAVACQRLQTACAQGTLFPAPPRTP
jgi:site-specific DNA-methyltransferase (adenine-specific)/modification methylase